MRIHWSTKAKILNLPQKWNLVIFAEALVPEAIPKNLANCRPFSTRNGRTD